MSHDIKLIDFKSDDREEIPDEEENDKMAENRFICRMVFTIQMFGINEKGETYSLTINNFKPYFYIKVPNTWKISDKNKLVEHFRNLVGDYYKDSIVDGTLVRKKKLYGFDAQSYHKFVVIRFKNMRCFNKVKNLWYGENKNIINNFDKSRGAWCLKPEGFKYKSVSLILYESNITPILRFFHINNISPSGWIRVQNKNLERCYNKLTTCKYEYNISCKNITALNNKDTLVPYKICSYDIEASSSHGDFPLAIKYYKKNAYNFMELFEKSDINDKNKLIEFLKRFIHTMFGYDNLYNVDDVFPKKKPTLEMLNKIIENIINKKIFELEKDVERDVNELEEEETNDPEDDDENKEKKTRAKKCDEKKTLIENLLDTYVRERKVEIIKKAFNSELPALEGDKVTFIGSTFIKYGEEKPYLNHCICLDTCSDVEGAEIESYNTETKVLLAWQKLIQREDPDIIIGYNIFGFDYSFMFDRATELNCQEKFLKLTRNINDSSGIPPQNESWRQPSEDNKKWKIQESTVFLASGEHNLRYFFMNGRLQIDLLNLFRREYNLDSYKLDHVSGHFIGDYVEKLEDKDDFTIVYSKNLQGLENNNFIVFEEIGHSSDMYLQGKKFEIYDIDITNCNFKIKDKVTPDMSKKVKWCLAKDDVSPQDIFRLTNQGPDERSIVAKYCIQDCNLVQNLLSKIDIITGFIEMAKICSVPMSYLVLRGQGIKLTSFIAKKCREKEVLMPVLDKSQDEDGYEGAIVLPPKCNIYTEEDPVAVNDYSSLYPSSMISENLSHDSKVWTKEYNLENELIQETGVKDGSGNFIYDNLPNYKYVDVKYDTYEKMRKTPKGAELKIKKGYKICRFAQFPEGRGVMPSVLDELLAARKATKKLIKTAPNPFMENVYDKRQLSIKLTANSLYGQCGAKTSTFYEKDVAASTTATGRKLLIYAKDIIEEIYDNKVCETKHGKVITNAEYVYGDTDSVFFKFNLTDTDGNKIIGKIALEITIELAQEAGRLCSMFLKYPHDLEYEKTFVPFILLSKKRYVGMLFETDPNKGKRKSMGIVLKRRDNAPVVKDVYGGIVDILMKEQNIGKAIEFVTSSLTDLVNGKVPLDKLVITKSLRSNYKNPDQIAHKVLADRIGKRDPGNKPKAGDRIAFAYIESEEKLQGNRIETPEYIRENNLKIDYSHYITNQIMKPCQQLFALVLEKLPEYEDRKSAYDTKLQNVKNKYGDDEDKFMKKEEELRAKEIKEIMFDQFLPKKTKGKKNVVPDFYI
jgi:DNA polymerase elongation subunit (family B)